MKNRILVIDDNSVNRMILYKMLSDDYEIIQAEDGIEAMDIIRSQYKTISAIILDLIMPKMDGKELMKQLAGERKYRNLPILIATGEHNDDLESECLQLGAWDFVTKPYNPIVIRLRLRNIISRSQVHLMNRIKNLAERDTLTGLYNRAHFMKQTENMIRENATTQFILVRMDIDQFRLYNTSFGSKAGDELLVQMANGVVRNLAEMGQERKTFGRIESDVFCICIPYDKERLEQQLKIAEQEMQGLCSTYRLKISV